eukprot:scaffold218582_cov31-Tisochrysis_lutea.AAC.2
MIQAAADASRAGENLADPVADALERFIACRTAVRVNSQCHACIAFKTGQISPRREDGYYVEETLTPPLP